MPIIERIVQELSFEADEFIDRLYDRNSVELDSQLIKRELAMQFGPNKG